jgi:dsDNA-specific endonuclease/ATPase MutS2
MKFEIGDKVIIHHSNEEGEIVDIIDRDMVMVDVRGIRFPVYTDQLDFPYFKRFTEKKSLEGKNIKKYVDQVPKEKSIDRNLAEDGVWLNFLPVITEDDFGDDIVKTLKIHLVNHLTLDFRFKYRLTYFGKTDLELQNELLHFQEFYLHDIEFENLNDSPAFEFEFSLQEPKKEKADYLESFLKLKAKQVFAKIEEIRQKQLASFSYKLFDKYPERPVTSEEPLAERIYPGARIYDASALRRNLEPARHEVDLHIEKLADDWQDMDALEILALQLRSFEKWFDLAIAHRLSSMVVIHGVGSGRLRDEIHEVLRLKKDVKFFVNRYHERYGYGATEIYFQYKK